MEIQEPIKLKDNIAIEIWKKYNTNMYHRYNLKLRSKIAKLIVLYLENATLSAHTRKSIVFQILDFNCTHMKIHFRN